MFVLESIVLVLSDLSLSLFLLLSPPLRMDVGLNIVNLLYFTDGRLVQLADDGLAGMLVLPEVP